LRKIKGGWRDVGQITWQLTPDREPSPRSSACGRRIVSGVATRSNPSTRRAKEDRGPRARQQYRQLHPLQWSAGTDWHARGGRDPVAVRGPSRVESTTRGPQYTAQMPAIALRRTSCKRRAAQSRSYLLPVPI